MSADRATLIDCPLHPRRTNSWLILREGQNLAILEADAGRLRHVHARVLRMDAEAFLGRALQDLEETVYAEPVDEYRMVRASGLLRLLIADNPSLLDKVKGARGATFRVHRPDFNISVGRTGDIAQGMGTGMLVGRWVAARDGHASRELSRADFLAHVVASSSWTGELTVKTVIRCRRDRIRRNPLRNSSPSRGREGRTGPSRPGRWP